MVFWDWSEMREISVCSSVSFSAYLFDVFLVGVSHLIMSVRLPQKDVIWPLTQAACRTDWRWGVLALDP
jgi:hypothetical protein